MAVVNAVSRWETHTAERPLIALMIPSLPFVTLDLHQSCHILHWHFFSTSVKQEMIYWVALVSPAVSNNSKYFVLLFLDLKKKFTIYFLLLQPFELFCCIVYVDERDFLYCNSICMGSFDSSTPGRETFPCLIGNFDP